MNTIIDQEIAYWKIHGLLWYKIKSFVNTSIFEFTRQLLLDYEVHDNIAFD